MAVGDNVKFKMGTQTQYDSASSIDQDALYFITDTKNLYKGSTLYNINTRAYTLVIGNKPAGDTIKDCDILYQSEYESSFYSELNATINDATSPITLFFRRGTYNIYDTLYVGAGKNVTIIGENRDGTILNEYHGITTHTSRNLIQVGGYSSSDIYNGIMCIKDITLKTSNDASYSRGYAIQCCGTLTVDHCKIIGSSKNTHGIYTEGHLTVTDSEISSCNYGIMARNCSRYNISNNELESCLYAVVTGFGGGYSNLPGTTDYQRNYQDGAGMSIQSEGCFGHICNNYIESAVSMGIYVGARSVVSGNVIYNPSVTGIDISSQYCNISDNIVKSGYGSIPQHVYRLTGNYCNFSNNIYFRQDGIPYFSGVYPLYCTASKCNITGNSLLFAVYGESSYISGVYFDDSARSNIVTSNRMALMNTMHSTNIQANNSSSI